MKKYIIKLNGKVYEVEIEEVPAGAVDILEETPCPAQAAAAQQQIMQAASKSSSIDRGQVIEAPMAGTIVGVFVKVGDVVKKGQLLVVLEAMKMENEIVSPVDGTVLSLSVTKGETVNAGDSIVQIG
jgi:glutaconyl-CoA/methylmalonyl-CoA decarboxylase subunit gamma